MTDINSLLRPGKVIKLISSENDTWELGISEIIGERLIVCELLLDPSEMPSKDNDSVYKVAISYGSGVYIVPSVIKPISGEDDRYKLALEEEYEFVQRREYFRLVDPDLEIICKIHGEIHPAKAMDLAGGGIGLLVERERSVKYDTLLELQVVFPDGKSVQIGARATHIVPADEPNKYFVGAYFSKISRPDESQVMKYIFNEQIRRSKEIKPSTELDYAS
jgi:hypothetical protein